MSEGQDDTFSYNAIIEQLDPGGGNPPPPPSPPPSNRGPGNDGGGPDGPRQSYNPAPPYLPPEELDFNRDRKRDLLQHSRDMERLGEKYESDGALIQLIGGALPNTPIIALWVVKAGIIYGGKKLEDYGTEFKASAAKMRAETLANWDNKAYDPIFIDFNADGLNLISQRDSGVFFDIDSDGYVERVAWTGDSLLVRDINGDGLIDNGAELGFSSDDQEGLTDFDHLVAFDDNHDGVIDASDAIFSELSVWNDVNQNGSVDVGEMQSFADAGGISIDLSPEAVDPEGGNVVFWFDADGDGLVDANELHASAEDAPAGAIAAQRVDGGLIFAEASIVTTSGVVNAYAAALDYSPLGASAVIIGSDLYFEFDDETTAVWRLLTNPGGENFDLAAGGYTGAVGGDGADTVFTSGSEDVIIFGADGNDVLTGGAGDDILSGGDGADTLVGGEGDDLILFDGDDLSVSVSGGGGYDSAFLTSTGGVTVNLELTQLEAIFGNEGDDTFIAGTVSNAILSGGGGNDTLTGGAGNDALMGGAGDDSLSGGAGDDLLWIDQEDSVVDGGDGFDHAIVSDDRGVSLNLTTTSIEWIKGGAGEDVFTAVGSTAGVMIDGGSGDDLLTGGNGNDRLAGGEGDDTIDGGSGLDAVSFTGRASDYQIIGDGISATVVDLNLADGDDGTETLEGVERLVFADTTIHLDGTNYVPVASGESWIFRDTAGGNLLSETGLLANDTDIDRDHLGVVAISAAANGRVSITSSGDIIFKADGASGQGSFDYLVSDGHGGTAAATSSVTVLQALPDDALFSYQWSLGWLNVYDVWDDYTGAGVKVAIHDNGVDPTHPDLIPNYDDTLDDDPGLGDHGTFTTGLVGAARNGSGIVGVAYDATITTNSLPGGWFEFYDDLSSFDVVNNSWSNIAVTIETNPFGREYTTEIQDQAAVGRGGLGTVTVFAAGNERLLGEDSNLYAEQGSRFVITVGSINNTGSYSGFSNPGTSVLVVAPGSDIVSDDIVGTGGYSDGSGQLGADYSNGSGTSAATPLVAGVVALMLQANPILGWRDVQEILAYSAWNSDPDSDGWSTNGANNWNGGGLHVSRDYGFGLVDARAAVRLAETWQSQGTSANEASTAHAAHIGEAISDNDGEAVSSTITVTDDILIDHVEVTLSLDHSNIGDLIIELISPDGTRSVLLNRLGVAPDSSTDRGSTANSINWTFTTTHDWGESSVGEWTLRIRDAATGEVGVVNHWSIQIYGDTASEDDTYIYTSDYGAMQSGVDVGRRTLTDGAGHDIINASPIFTDTLLDLRPDSVSQLAGNSLHITAGTVIEDAYLGDGDDTVYGNDADNLLYAGRGDDLLEGGAGADVLDGAQGSDTASYAGSAAAVSIDLAAGNTSGGDAEDDTLLSIEGLLGSAFADTLSGNAGDNVLSGNAGDDMLAGRDGDDLLQGGDGADVLDGGDDNDKLVGGLGDDTIDGGAGEDMAYFAGDIGDYTISTVGGVTTVTGQDGNDELTNVEFLSFRDGRVHIGGNQGPTAVSQFHTVTQRGPLATSTASLLSGAADLDGDTLSLHYVYRSDHGTVTLPVAGVVHFEVDPDFVGTTSYGFSVTDGKGGEGYATVFVTVNATYTFSGTTGDDTFFGLGSVDTVYGGDGADLLDGGYGADEIYGGTGNDQLIGGAGADALSGGDNNDVLAGGVGADNIDGGDGVDTASYAAAVGAVTVSLLTGTGTRGEANGDTLTAVENLTGSAFDDVLTGDENANTLTGLAGNDTLDGGAAIDTLAGGAGDDILRGGAGADVLDGGFGHDIASYLTATEAVAVNLTSGSKTGADASGDTYVSIEGVEGSNFNDTLTGSAAADTLIGAGGGDTLAGLGGSDTYIHRANDGDDVIQEGYSTTDADRLMFGTGLVSQKLIITRSLSDLSDVTLQFQGYTGTVAINDQFYGQGMYGIEQFVFGNGVVWGRDDLRQAYIVQNQTSGADTLRAFDGRNDVLTGGLGDDVVYGYSGSDTYHYREGDGNDTIYEDYAPSDFDRLVLGEDLLASDAVVVRSISDVNDARLTFTGKTGSIVLDAQFYNPNYGLEEIEFGDGVTWSKARLLQEADGTVATGGNESLHGAGNFDDTLEGLAGADSLYGYSGSDTYVYESGDGVDTIYEVADAGDTDTLVLGAGILTSDVTVVRSLSDLDDFTLVIAGVGTNTITLDEGFAEQAGSGIESVVFNDTTVWTKDHLRAASLVSAQTSGNDTIVGFNGRADTLDGGAGNDKLYGHSGADTYLVAANGGDDEVYEGHDAVAIDRLVLGTGLVAADLVISRSGADASDMILQFAGYSGTILLDGEFMFEAGYGVEEIEFGDTTVWTTQDLLKAFAASDATLGGDTLYGENDQRDFLHGLGGDDVLIGGSGSDIYYWDASDGHDSIEEASAAVGFDRLILGSGLSAENATVSRDASDTATVVISFTSSAGSIRLVDQFDNEGGDQIEMVTFADGTSWDEATLRQIYLDTAGSSGNDQIIGFAGSHDTLNGRGGNDHLNGDTGSDIYLYNSGDGNDTIVDWSESNAGSVDRLEFGSGIEAADLVVDRSSTYPNDVILTFNNASGSINLFYQFFGDFGYGIERFVFDDGTVWTNADLRAAYLSQAIAAGDDTIYGFHYVDDLLDFSDGFDTAYGLTGSDTFVYTLGDGDVSIVEEQGNFSTEADTLRLHNLTTEEVTLGWSYSNSDLLIVINATGETITLVSQQEGDYDGGTGIEHIIFDDATDWTRDDIDARAVLFGSEGINWLEGNNSDNAFRGLGGDDLIIGMGGSDTYQYSVGDGYDQIWDYGGGLEDVDVLQLLDVLPDDVTLWFDGNGALYVQIISTGEGIVVDDQFGYDLFGPENNAATDGIEQIRFSNGTVWDREQIRDAAGLAPPSYIPGTEGDDILVGDNAVNTIEAFGGNDTLYGEGNDDVLLAGDGDDTVYGGAGYDEMHDGAGNDTLYGGDDDDYFTAGADGGNDLFDGGDGSDTIEYVGVSVALNINLANQTVTGTGLGVDTLVSIEGAYGDTGNDTLIGSSGDNFLSSGDGNDTLEGGAGNDFLIGGAGDDNYLVNLGDGEDVIRDIGASSDMDILVFGAGIESEDVTVTSDGSGGALLTIGSSGGSIRLAYQVVSAEDGVEEIHFADNTVWTAEDLAEMIDPGGGGGNEPDIVKPQSVANTSIEDAIDVLQEFFDLDENAEIAASTTIPHASVEATGSGQGEEFYTVTVGAGDRAIFDIDHNSFDTIIRLLDAAGNQIAFDDDNSGDPGSSSGSSLIDYTFATGGTYYLAVGKYGTSAGPDAGSIYTLNVSIEDGFVEPVLVTVNKPDFTKLQTVANTSIPNSIDLTGYYDLVDGEYVELATQLPHATVVATASGGGEEYYAFTVGAGDQAVFDIDHNSFDTIIRLLDAGGNQIAFSDDDGDDPGSTGTSSLIEYTFTAAGTYYLAVGRYGTSAGPSAGSTYTLHLSVESAGIEIAGDEGDNILIARQGNDTVLGAGGNDSLTGGAGNDTLIGGDGTDTAIYSGNQSDYLISYDALTQSVTVVDQRVGAADGTDTVSEVELLQFADGTVDALPADNSAPTDITLSNLSVEENVATGTVVGTLGASDPDSGDTYTFSLVEGATDVFEVSGDQIVVKAGAAIDYETDGSYDLTVRVTDQGGLTFDKAFTVNVTNVSGNIVGTAGNETLVGTSEEDTIQGLSGNDSLQGGAGDDAIDGGSGSDVAVFGGSYASYTVTWDGTTATVAGPDGTDTITTVERLQFLDRSVWLVDDGAELNTIQSAVNFAADGDVILIGAGNYTEDVTIAGKSLTIDGGDDVGLSATTLHGQMTVSGTLNGAFTIKDIAIDATGRSYGVFVSANSTAYAGSVTLDNTTVSNAKLDGFAYIRAGNGSTPTLADTIGAVSILNSEFFGNATQTGSGGGRGDILLFGFNGDLTLHGVTIHDPGAGAQKAIQVRGIQDGSDVTGSGPYDAAGDIVLSDLTITGNYAQDLVAFYRMAGFASFTTDDVELNASAPWGLVNFDGVGGSIDLSTGVVATNTSGGPIATQQGLASADTFNGTAGNDVLIGRSGADTLLGNDGNDTLIGGGNGDILNGGDGSDTASYAGSTVGVTVSLTTGTGTGGDAQGDILTAIENLSGSSFADTLTGDSNGNALLGGAGGDTLNGAGGNDVLTGGADNDTFVFNAGFGQDTISDFTAGASSVDVIEFQDNIFADYAAVMAAASTVGADTVITVDGSTSITLQNVTLASLHQDDFRFV